MSDCPLLEVTYRPGRCDVVLAHPPMNLFDPEMSDALEGLVADLLSRDDLRVVVFESGVPDYFMAHLDTDRAQELDVAPRASGLSAWPDVTTRLERAPFVTIGKIRGRARGVGAEFLAALDMRFASRENALLAQLEVGAALIPGGGGLERLPLLVNRGRALEVIVGADDFDADTAERYGWINRALPDGELDAFVDRLASRIAGFDREAVATAKRVVGERSPLARPADLIATQQTFFQMLGGPTASARLAVLGERGFNRVPAFELALGDALSRP
jgi:enoyl-CoA hydratase/carnithine racemase